MVMTSLVGMLLAVTTCPPGQSVSPDTAGQCCWSAQVWSKLQNRCVGVPACPAGTQAQGEVCVTACPAGQAVSGDTAGRCCWPNQAFSASRNVCVGIPSCPAGMVASGESCAQAQYAQPPPPQYPPQYQPQYQPPPPQYQQPPPPQYQQPPPPQYAQPPPAQYAQPPRDAPIAGPVNAPDKRTELQTNLIDLRQRHSHITFGAEITMLVIGIPALAIGLPLAIGGIGSDNVGIGVLGLIMVGVGLPLALIGGLAIPNKARAKGRLSKEIKATEAELHALDTRARLIPLPAPAAGLLLALSSPIFTF